MASTAFFLVFPADMSSPNIFSGYDPLVAGILRWVRNDIVRPGSLPFGMNLTLIGGTLTAPLEILLYASLALGVVVSSPVIAYEIYRFVDPALYPEERRAIFPFLLSFIGLFIIGLIFGYKILAPLVIVGTLLFFPPLQTQPIVFIGDFYQLVFVTVLASGFSFTLPVFFVLLVKFGVFSTRMVTRNRKFIYLGIYIIAAWLTPDGGLIGDALLFFPLIALLEMSVLIGRRYEKKRLE